MSFVADPHNFGKQVSQEEGASGMFFRKPRPLFWEWLFFGKNSPLAAAFLATGNPVAIKIASSFFNLEIINDPDDIGGLSREIKSGNNLMRTAATDELFCFGALMAYCYIFGILDLHEFNVVRTDTHLQVIDAEVVLCDVLLPNQTLLLPFKNIRFNKSALRHFFNSEGAITANDVENILQGFTHCVEIIESARAQIASTFHDLAQVAGSVPIRHIMRDTSIYLRYPDITPDVPLSRAEVEQLERGDVPYFFKFMGDPRLLYYTSSKGDFAEAVAPNHFRDSIEKTAVNPISLLDTMRLKKHLFPTGALFIANKLLPSDYVGHMQLLTSTTLNLTEDQVTVVTPYGKFQSGRSPK